MGPLIVLKTIEFTNWLEDQNPKDRLIIDSRISRIQTDAYFGDCKDLGDSLLELRWKNGRRIYFAKLQYQNVFLLIGGFKNAQKKDIKKARHLLRRYT